MRIEHHPILGEFPKGRKVQFTLDGKPMEGYEGEPIAAALRAAGVMTHRHTSGWTNPAAFFVQLAVAPTA